MTNEYINRIRLGSFFPSSSSATICNVKIKPIGELELKRIKQGILDYLKSHESAAISELSEFLRVEPKKIVLAITELKKESLIFNK